MFLWNVWSDFFLDRWRRSGVIRMSAAAPRALTALKSDDLLAQMCARQTPPGGSKTDGRQHLYRLVDLADFAPNVPCGVRSHDFRLLGT